MTTASIGNGAKELLDEVATGKVTGEEEAFSHTDLVDFAANVEGAEKAFDVLRPLAAQGDPALVTTLTPAFADVDEALAVAPHGRRLRLLRHRRRGRPPRARPGRRRARRAAVPPGRGRASDDAPAAPTHGRAA